MVYNLSNITAANDISTIMTTTNDLSGQLIFYVLLLVLFLVFIVTYKQQSFSQVVIAASFLMTLISIYAFTMLWVDETIPVIATTMLMFSIVTYMFTNR